MARCTNCGEENPEGFRFCGACGTELAAAPPPSREVRKTVTVVFGDVTGSTAMGERLDPESTRRVMSRYFEAMREAVERHGGTVEKFIGDAVMAVFGIPIVHEDDALRAVRAAADMREALTVLNDELERDWGVRLESRIGVNTGEVVAGEGETLAVGDAVNVAARLEQGAAPGETLLGETTHRLVRDAVEAEPVEPLEAKGKSEPLAAYRLTGLVEGAEFIRRRLDSPLVGRENELGQLLRAFDHAVSERVAYLFTLLGPAGIGKSRLVQELHSRVDATLLAGRCLPYGEGITYWPLLEMEPLSQAIDFNANRDDIALQTRRFFEQNARERPLLLVFDDFQWAEPTFLDLVDHLTDLTRDAPMLVVCVARPDLLDLRPGWGGGKLNATTMQLEALTEAEVEQLADNLLAQVDGRIKARVAAAAEGNPLYVEEMLAMLAEGASGDLAIPPTIQALLASRLDRLTADERMTVECAAIQGQEFRQDALASLVPEELGERLSEIHHSLVRKDLVRPSGDETFKFKHLLLRDAAYDALPKEQRAELHERFADWLEPVEPELEEIRGYHLEQAYRYRTELGPADDRTRKLARRGAALLASAGHRANERGDVHATATLLDRAIALLPEDDPDAVALLPELGDALVETGNISRAAALLRHAELKGDPRTRLLGRLRGTMVRLMQGGSMNAAVDRYDEALREAERLGDDSILAEVYCRRGGLALWLNDYRTARSMFDESLRRAISAGDSRQISETVIWLSVGIMWGDTPVAEGRRILDELAGLSIHGVAASQVLVAQGVMHALVGEFDQARALTAEGRATTRELGQQVQFASLAQVEAVVELLAHDFQRAEWLLREARDILSDAGERGYLSTVCAMLAQILVHQNELDEAERLVAEAEALAADDDYTTTLHVVVTRAMLAGRRGGDADAARLATEVATLADDLFAGPMALVEIADYLPPEERELALRQAVDGAEQKGNLVTAAEARAMLSAPP
jgi:class 3 adenylate cyclase/tetratricopeptide (TPR) repeat protein